MDSDHGGVEPAKGIGSEEKIGWEEIGCEDRPEESR
jgi:hypothetical protein